MRAVGLLLEFKPTILSLGRRCDYLLLTARCLSLQPRRGNTVSSRNETFEYLKRKIENSAIFQFSMPWKGDVGFVRLWTPASQQIARWHTTSTIIQCTKKPEVADKLTRLPRDRRRREFEPPWELILYYCLRFALFFAVVEIMTRESWSSC